jgi:hypothetical protein
LSLEEPLVEEVALVLVVLAVAVDAPAAAVDAELAAALAAPLVAALAAPPVAAWEAELAADPVDAATA